MKFFVELERLKKDTKAAKDEMKEKARQIRNKSKFQLGGDDTDNEELENQAMN